MKRLSFQFTLAVVLASCAACVPPASSPADAGQDPVTDAGVPVDGGGNPETDAGISVDGGDNPVTDAGVEVDGGAPPPDPNADFSNPESVLWNAAENSYFVSNIYGESDAEDGIGWIAKLDAEGVVVDARWVDGLNAPKGMALSGARLYVADIGDLVEINAATGEVLNRIAVPNAIFLNDVTANESTVWMSDTFGGAVFSYTPATQALAELARDPALATINGLEFDGTRLIGGTIGDFFDPADLGDVVGISLAADTLGDVSVLASGVAKIDGIVKRGTTGFLATDFRGMLLSIAPDGATTTIRDLATEFGMMSSADLGYDPVRDRVAIPDLFAGNVVFVDVDPLAYDRPESALWNAAENSYYVSSIYGDSDVADGIGWIAKLDADGVVVEPRWVEGLNAPKGMALSGPNLYVADLTDLVEINAATGEIQSRITIPGALFLNDVTASDDAVWVSDTFSGSIIRYTPATQMVAVVAQDAALASINGIEYDDTRLVGGTTGDFFDPTDLGDVVSISLAAETLGEVTVLAAGVAKIDGIVKRGENGFLATDFGGRLLSVSSDGTTTTLIDLNAEYGMLSAADLGYDVARDQVAVPDLFGANVVFIDLAAP